jgi:hypothetical protein
MKKICLMFLVVIFGFGVSAFTPPVSSIENGVDKVDEVASCLTWKKEKTSSGYQFQFTNSCTDKKVRVTYEYYDTSTYKWIENVVIVPPQEKKTGTLGSDGQHRNVDYELL